MSPFPQRTLPGLNPSPTLLTQLHYSTLDPFPTDRPSPAPARLPAGPAGSWCRLALTAGARAPPAALSAQAGWREQAAGEGEQRADP